MTKRPAKILIVDDSAMSRHELAIALRGTYEIAEAEHGAIALSCARQSRFDLIITDLNMPVMGGIELTRLLRSLSEYKSTPIFAITSESDHSAVQRGKAAGMTAWIVKPVNATMLQRAVQTVLSKSTTDAAQR